MLIKTLFKFEILIDILVMPGFRLPEMRTENCIVFCLTESHDEMGQVEINVHV